MHLHKACEKPLSEGSPMFIPSSKGSKPLRCAKTLHCGTCPWTDAVSSWLSKVGLQSFKKHMEAEMAGIPGLRSESAWQIFTRWAYYVKNPVKSGTKQNIGLLEWECVFDWPLIGMILIFGFIQTMFSDELFEVSAARSHKTQACCGVFALCCCARENQAIDLHLSFLYSILSMFYIYSSKMLFCWDSGMLWSQPC